MVQKGVEDRKYHVQNDLRHSALFGTGSATYRVTGNATGVADVGLVGEKAMTKTVRYDGEYDHVIESARRVRYGDATVAEEARKLHAQCGLGEDFLRRVIRTYALDKLTIL